jgi:hydrophobe/amphiphile efflux-1 (HAE1) family protein
MNLIDLSLRRPLFAWVLMFSLIVFGAIAINRMGVSQMPDVNFPILNISVAYEGASPEVVESEVIDPLESRLLAIEGIKEMRSSAKQGAANVTLELDIERNVDVALQEVQSALSQMNLPPGVDTPIIRKQNPEEDPIMILSVYGDKPVREILNWTDSYFLDQLRFLPGVGEVSVGGFSDRNLRIWLDRKKLEALNLTVGDVVEAMKTQHVESAAGQFTEGEKDFRVRWLGEATEVDDVKKIRILKRGGQIIYGPQYTIGDVAGVEDGLSDIKRIARVKGQRAIAIQVKKQRGTNEVEVAKALLERIESLKKDFPEGIQYRVTVNYTKATDAMVWLTFEKLMLAALVTLLVCWLFLGNVSSAVNILFSIPTSIIGSMIILYYSKFTLNLFTLLSLTLAISIVVDDAIMLLENIVRHYRMGKSPYLAASEGAKEVLPATIAATLAVVAVFLPVIFMKGLIGKFFFQFGVTMSAAVLLSLLEAVTITPMRTAAFLQSSHNSQGGKLVYSRFENYLENLFEHWGAFYHKVLKYTLNRKNWVILGSLLFFAVSLFLIRKVKQEFVPQQDQNIILIMGQMPPGTALKTMSAAAEEIEKVINSNPHVEGFLTSVGTGGGGGPMGSQIFMPVTLKPRSERTLSHTQIMDQFRAEFKKLKKIRINMRDMSARNLSSGKLNPVALNLRGPELKVLDQKSQELIDRLEKEGLAVDLDRDYRAGVPEIKVTPRRNEMALRGVSVDAVGQLLSAGVGGLKVGRYTAGGRRYDIRFKLREDQMTTSKDFEQLFVRNMAGNLIPLRELVDIEENMSSLSINRINRLRAISVFGNLAPGKSQAVVLKRAQKIAKEILPEGYSFGLEGAAAGFSEAFGGLTVAMAMGILVAYLILAVQFNSLLHPVSVLMALPFSISGALMALWGFNISLNLFSFIGLVVLMGIAKKNSILLVEFTNQVRESEQFKKQAQKDSNNTFEALLQACPIRLRPILMTSIATILAALP